MTVSEIFNAISNHQIEGIMLHGQMADYFDFYPCTVLNACRNTTILTNQPACDLYTDITSTITGSFCPEGIRRGLRLFLRVGEIIRDKKLTPAQNGAHPGCIY